MANPNACSRPVVAGRGPDDEPRGRRPTPSRRAPRRRPGLDRPAGARSPTARTSASAGSGRRSASSKRRSQVFGEVGYHGCGVKRITELSGYSRASFYQYFSSKEDLFRHLAGRVARQLNESAEALEPITGDQAGWDALHAWLEPLLGRSTTPTSRSSSPSRPPSRATPWSRAARRSSLNRTLHGPAREDRRLAAAVRARSTRWCARCCRRSARLNRETRAARARRARRPRSTGPGSNIAFADVFHRALFGPDRGRQHPHRRPSGSSRSPRPARWHRRRTPTSDPSPRAGRAAHPRRSCSRPVTRSSSSGATTPPASPTSSKAAGVSHGVFYRYFDNKTDLFRILAEQASRQLARRPRRAFPARWSRRRARRRDELRAWLRRYADTYAAEASIFTMWSEAISRDEELGERVGRGHRRLPGAASPATSSRAGWGDVDADGHRAARLPRRHDVAARRRPGPHRGQSPG